VSTERKIGLAAPSISREPSSAWMKVGPRLLIS
jgi:hypothetical protein